MTAAFSATYADWKLVKSRKVVQIVLEVAMEDSDAAYKLLGGMPNPAAETWVGVAKLVKQPEQKERRRWEMLSIGERAGIRCNEKAFQEFLGVENTEDAATFLRNSFGVQSRKDIPADKWAELDGEYDLWCRSGGQ